MGEIAKFGANLSDAHVARVDLERDRLAFERERMEFDHEERIQDREERCIERLKSQKLGLDKLELMIAVFTDK